MVIGSATCPATPVDSIKDVVRSSVKVLEFDKHLKKAGGSIGRNVVVITIKMKTIVRKPLMISLNRRSFKVKTVYYSSVYSLPFATFIFEQNYR